MKLGATGALPDKQPSYLNWKTNDQLTRTAISLAMKMKTSAYMSDTALMDSWIRGIYRSVHFNGEYHFTRESQRDMGDGSRIQFIWNKSDQWQTLSLSLDKKYKTSYWLDADAGTVTNTAGTAITRTLAPYGSVILYASTKSNPLPHADTVTASVTDKSKEIITLKRWDLKTDSLSLKDTTLFDWRDNPRLKYSSAEGSYTTSFGWNKAPDAAHYYLDMGNVYFTAEVYVNGTYAGKRIFAPYMLDYQIAATRHKQH